MNQFNSYVKNPIIQQQRRQLKRAKQKPRTDRKKLAVITYSKGFRIKHMPSIRQSIRQLNLKSIKTFKRYNNATLRYICKQYLAYWKIPIRATIVNGVFFENYNQAYNSLTRMVKLGLLVKQDKDFFVK